MVSAIPNNLQKFLAKTPRGRYAAAARIWSRAFPAVPVPFRLPFGAWWLARGGRLDDRIVEGTFEPAELKFVEEFLQSGMTVLDIGAHHGLYTLLASRRVGKTGQVIAFEPSPRERELLEQHLRINRCSNVRVESAALGSAAGRAELFVVEGGEDGCNSLRNPVVAEKTNLVEVKVLALDDWLEQHGSPRVDFMKLDVEGGELEVLRGADRLLNQHLRPVVFAEIQDVRTEPWGYRAREIALELDMHGYRLFEITKTLKLQATPVDLAAYDGNYVACPEEKLPSIASFLA
jgi:FkbM family methyltransferase